MTGAGVNLRSRNLRIEGKNRDQTKVGGKGSTAVTAGGKKKRQLSNCDGINDWEEPKKEENLLGKNPWGSIYYMGGIHLVFGPTLKSRPGRRERQTNGVSKMRYSLPFRVRDLKHRGIKTMCLK